MNGIRVKFCDFKKVVKVDFNYDLQNAKNNNQPDVINSAIFENRTPSANKKTFTTSKTRSNTESWSNTLGATLSISSTVTVGVPEIASTGVTVSAELRNDFTFGKEYSEQQTFADATEVNVDGCTSVKVSMIAQKGSANIPYTATLTYGDGSTEKISGTWRGVAFFDSYTKTEVIAKNLCSLQTLALAQVSTATQQVGETISNNLYGATKLAAATALLGGFVYLVKKIQKRNDKNSLSEAFIKV